LNGRLRSSPTCRAAKSAPSADRRGSVEYKQNMARVLVGRALREAVERAGGR
jgi:CO/xanthine dehydrogenase FAD-binding subunit